jgi:DNA invertase Pin-like site-specific DNA recombinase
MLLVPYLRVSDEDTQSVDSSGQLHAIELWATEHGHELTAPESDERSGALGPDRRPGLARALDLVRRNGKRRKPGQPEGIVSWDRKRLCRNARLCNWLAYEAERGGFRIFTTDGFDSADGSDLALFSEAMHGVLGDLERKGIGRATAKALRQRKAAGRVYSRIIPFGWRAIAGRLDPAPDELAILERMRELAATGLGPTAIAHELNRAGMMNRGRRWIRQNVSHLLARSAAGASS